MLQEKINEAPITRRAKLGDRLKAKLSEGAILTKSYYNDNLKTLEAIPAAKKLWDEANFLSQAKNRGASFFTGPCHCHPGKS